MTLADWVSESAQRYQTQDPRRATRRSLHELRMGAQRRVGKRLGRPIWQRGDWDVLVVLDACRYDTWQAVAPEYGLPQRGRVWSNASCSIDWILANFNDCPEDIRSAGYVTGNPFADHDAEDARSADLRKSELSYFAPIYETHWGPIDGGQVETIAPADVTDQAISAWRNRRQHGIDRLVVHYMQPHQPYRSRPDWVGVGKNLKNLVQDRTKAGACAWQRCRRGEIEQEELFAAVRDNLRWVLDDVTERFLDNVDGRVVLTSDHGNAAGEWGEWGHPPGAIGPAVRRVPWVSVDCTDERTVTPTVRGVEPGDTDVNDRLETLGYT